MKKQSLIIIIITLLFFLNNACNNNNSNQYSFESSFMTNDTCKVVSHDHYFFECYGYFLNPIELQNHFSKQFSINKELTYGYGDSSMIDTLYRVVKDKSFIKFLYTNSTDEKESMKIVSARINNPELVMTNGLKTGLEKRLALTMLFGKGYNRDLNKIDNFQIITALEGLWINIGFNDEKLSKISIDSDYQVDQH
jgi:hypothetical protein